MADPGVMSPTQAIVTGPRGGAGALRLVAAPPLPAPAPAPATDATMPTTADSARASEPTAMARRRWYVADVGRGAGSETSIPLLAVRQRRTAPSAARGSAAAAWWMNPAGGLAKSQRGERLEAGPRNLGTAVAVTALELPGGAGGGEEPARRMQRPATSGGGVGRRHHDRQHAHLAARVALATRLGAQAAAIKARPERLEVLVGVELARARPPDHQRVAGIERHGQAVRAESIGIAEGEGHTGGREGAAVMRGAASAARQDDGQEQPASYARRHTRPAAGRPARALITPHARPAPAAGASRPRAGSRWRPGPPGWRRTRGCARPGQPRPPSGAAARRQR